VSGPLIAGVRLVTADHVCRAVEQVLTEHMPGWASAADLSPVTTWQQLPTPQAISSAAVPVGAITSPGLTGPPVKHRGKYKATWRVVVSLYDRGKDHSDTQRKAREWAALIRTVLVQHPRIGGLAQELTWIAEDYAVLPDQRNARTLAGCFAAFDITVDDVVPDVAPPELGGPGPDPLVTETKTAVTVARPTVSFG
jgi:hypothetical protein